MRLCLGCKDLRTVDYGREGYGLICPKMGDIHPRGEYISTEFGFKVPHAESETCYTPRSQIKV
jgi:hypothetical protein